MTTSLRPTRPLIAEARGLERRLSFILEDLVILLGEANGMVREHAQTAPIEDIELVASATSAIGIATGSVDIALRNMSMHADGAPATTQSFAIEIPA